jgi:hypothetical protein
LRGAIRAAIVEQGADDSAPTYIIDWRYEGVLWPGDRAALFGSDRGILSLDDPTLKLLAELKRGDRPAFLSSDIGIVPLPKREFWGWPDAKRAFIFGPLSIRTSRAGTSSIATVTGTLMMRITDIDEFRTNYLAEIGFAKKVCPTPERRRGPKPKLRATIADKMLEDLISKRRTPEELSGDTLAALIANYGASPNTAKMARQDALAKFTEFQSSKL